MIQLIKQKKTGDMQLLYKHGYFGIKENELSISFLNNDRRKVGYILVMDNDSILNMVDELLEYLRR